VHASCLFLDDSLRANVAPRCVAQIRVDACLRDVWLLLMSRDAFVFDGRTPALDHDFRLLTELVDFLAKAAPDADPFKYMRDFRRFIASSFLPSVGMPTSVSLS
jgi:hypothetical protein